MVSFYKMEVCMKKLGDVLLAVAAVSAAVGVISRITMTPVNGIFASAFLQFAVLAVLFSIALSLRGK